jgi:predicted metal-dependent peptidase
MMMGYYSSPNPCAYTTRGPPPLVSQNSRPPRRFPHLIGVFPAQLRQAAKPIILAVVDTSESITSRLLEQLNGELARLARSFRVKVVECDAKIQRVYEYRH